MKTRLYIFSLFAFLLSNFAEAQFQPIPASTNNSWRYLPATVSRVGVGNFAAGTNLSSTLQVNGFTTTFPTSDVFRTDGSNAAANTWRMFTGATSTTTTEKGALFTGGNLNSAPNDFCMRASTVGGGGGDLVFYTQNNTECMRIKGSTGFGSQIGFIGVNRKFPLSMIHIDGAPPSTNPNSTFAAGWRIWMRVGVFSQWDSDGLFVGLKDEGSNRKDAVIAWSDDPAPAPNGPDFLRFIFTNNTGATVPNGGGPDGIEVGRWSPLDGYLGIGNFYNSPITQTPAARLEILPNPLVSANTPTFRITQVQQNPATPNTSGKFTDMYTSTTGDLIIQPNDNTQAPLNRDRFVGINTGIPRNTLEINSQALTPGGNGSNGLRFTDMKYGVSTPAVPLANQGVLSVDANGDVVYIQGGTGNAFGTCGGPIPALTNNSALDLNNFNLHFAGTTVNSRVGIGTSCAAPLFAKLTVNESSGNTSGSIGELILNSNNSGTATVFGVLSALNPTSPSGLDIGYTAGFFSANGSKRCVGVEGRANGQASVGSANYAGYFVAQNGGNNVAVYGEVIAAGSGNIAGHFKALAPGSYAGYFDGDVQFNANVLGSQFGWTSDQNLKTNIDSIANSLSIINQLQPKTFYYDTLNSHGLIFPSEKQYGLIAQQVDTVLPELVSTVTKPADYDTSGNIINAAYTYKTLNYNAFIAILMKGIQEQQSQIQSQNARIDSLQNQINSCCASSERHTNSQNRNQTDVHLSDIESIVLDQNVPNPFAEQTTITYNLPETVQKAQLLFYDSQGKLIKAVDLTSRGKGQLNVFADDLTSGIYSYALVADGQIADTKRMVKTN